MNTWCVYGSLWSPKTKPQHFIQKTCYGGGVPPPLKSAQTGLVNRKYENMETHRFCKNARISQSSFFGDWTKEYAAKLQRTHPIKGLHFTWRINDNGGVARTVMTLCHCCSCCCRRKKTWLYHLITCKGLMETRHSSFYSWIWSKFWNIAKFIWWRRG